jgi:hypothetical protein
MLGPRGTLNGSKGPELDEGKECERSETMEVLAKVNRFGSAGD